ncbi:MAG: endolytic transglycosylase MltG [Actinomycetota bacterium]|nr:endolytic transglycosylase MltG [Actinomycetota bacterium]
MSFSPLQVDAEGDVEAEFGRRFETFRVHHRRRRWIPWLVGFVFAAILVSGLGVLWVRGQIDPGRPGGAVSFTIPPNSSTATIASILGGAGVIRDPTVFRFYVKAQGAGSLLPGEYHLPRNSSYDSVISALQKGPPVVYQKFTIPEGFTLAQIATRVGNLPGRTAADFMAAATSGQVRSRLQPSGQPSLEGLMFPATYEVRADASDLSIVQKMVATFDDNATNQGVDQAAAALGVTPYQVIVVASMVEREAKLDEDRGPIASVIYNRLHKNTLLQIDATLLYGQGISDPGKIDKKSDSPYNTYKFKGLPPTPIASPGVPSLAAAAHPPSTAYIYYRTVDVNGKHGFAVTAAEFAKLEAEARAKGLP